MALGELESNPTASLSKPPDGSPGRGSLPCGWIFAEAGYQDLFGEGSYAGKGIYDVDAFEAALAGRAPDSTLLSHDLFEGVFARAGLASDIEVVEEFPARYDVGAIRHHRWARGDWQLLPWILGRAPRQAGVERATSARTWLEIVTPGRRGGMAATTGMRVGATIVKTTNRVQISAA